ncbi:MAG: hypothetical protein ACI4C7_11060, partial [Clostridia bacterium]
RQKWLKPKVSTIGGTFGFNSENIQNQCQKALILGCRHYADSLKRVCDFSHTRFNKFPFVQ